MDSILEPSRQHQQQQQQQHGDAESSLSLIHDRDDEHQLQHQLQHPPAGGVLSSCSSILTESNLLRWSRIHSMNGIVPPPRSGAASVVACGKLFVFGGYGGGTGRLDDFWSFSFDTQTWEKVRVQSRRRPGCRENNGVVISGTFDDYYYNNDDNADADANDEDADGKNSIKNTSSRAAKIFLFGGYNGSAWLNDLWEFNIETSCWTCIQESSDPVAAAAAAPLPLPPSPGDQDVSAVERRMINVSINDGSHFNNNNNSNNVSIVPSRRFGYVSVVHKGKLILWGGFDGSRWLNDMYVFDFAKKEWTEIPQVNNSNNNTATATANGNSSSSSSSSQANNASMAIPSVRSCPAWAKDDNYVYIQGGYDGVERKSDFWACDLNTYTWTQMPSSRGTPPSPRYFHSCCLLRSNSDSGGGGGVGRDNDGGSAGVSCLDSSNRNKLYLYGGYSGAERLADMYVYEFETQHWSRVDCTAGDAPSGRSSMVAQAHEGSLWIFGGYNGSTVLNDFYKFRLSSICIPPTRLVSDFRRLLSTASDFASDVTFRVEGKAVPAHRAILAIRSEYFRVLLCGGYMRESSSYQISSRDNDVKDSNQNDVAKPSATTTTDSLESSSASDSARDDKSSEKKKASAASDSAIVAGEIEIQDVSYEVFLMVLEFLYTDTVVELTSSSSSSSLDLGIHLLIASERFMLDRLKALCEDVIRKQVHVDNVMAILVASHVYNAKSLKDLTLDFILRHLPHPAVMNGLSDLRSEPDLLLEIIKRNSGNQGNSNNSQNHQRQYSHQYHPHEHSQSHRQQHQYENYNNHSPTSLSRYHHQAYHNDTASAANAGAGGVAAAAVAMNNIRAGGVNDNSFNFDNGIGGGDARQQQDFSSARSSVQGPFGSEWSRR